MKIALYIFSTWIFFASFSLFDNYIDPTGTYGLGNKTINDGEDIYGYFGQIRVKRLTINKIFMTFEICKGAPSYNSGSFEDTLDYVDNRAIYSVPDIDISCIITFDFSNEGVIVREETDDYNWGCGFGHAVVADGFFKKNSSDEPELYNVFR